MAERETDRYRDSELTLNAGYKFQGPMGQALLIALGDAFDEAVYGVKQAVKARYPTLTSPSVRSIIGEERQMLRGPGEVEVSYGNRLRAAWDTWRWGGTPFGLLTALSAAGYGNAKLLIHNGRQFHLDGTGTLVTTILNPLGFTPRAERGFWSEFELILDKPHPASWYTGAAFTPPAEESDEANLIRYLVNIWKPAHATLSRITLRDEGYLWGYPNQTWGEASAAGLTWGGANEVHWHS